MDRTRAMVGIALLAAPALCAAAEPGAGAPSDWVARFAFEAPAAVAAGRCPSGGKLPSFRVVPAAAGAQIVRVSLPFPPGALPADRGLGVRIGRTALVPDVRPLTYHPGTPRSVRRAILTFRFDFSDLKEHEFSLALRRQPPAVPEPQTSGGTFSGRAGDTQIALDASRVHVLRGGKEIWSAELLAPARSSQAPPTVEVIERGACCLWVRLLVPDPVWPRILEVRADSLGTVGVRAHLQRFEKGDGYAPDLGWKIRGPGLRALHTAKGDLPAGVEDARHAFAAGEDAWCEGDAGWARFPDAALFGRRGLTVHAAGSGSEVTYLRCRADEQVPHQEAAWRTASFVVGPPGAAPWNALLEPAHTVRVAAPAFDALYGMGAPPDLSKWPDLQEFSAFQRDAVAKSALAGDDSGNVTGYQGGPFGMNRLNHCPAIFNEYARSGDARLREIAVRWCENFHDLSVWWGTGREGEFGGTRYNNVLAMGDSTHKADTHFMWRSNTAVPFCTKGFDAFFQAYEETGDPRMAAALRWQVDYSRRMVHAGLNYCRNIGMAEDFLRLYHFTGDEAYLGDAIRLFGELRPLLSDGDLFTESGKPIDRDPPFIENDKDGYEHPFAKPYIIGYALNGLPDLLRLRPEEPKLCEVVRAVADFLAATIDPAGGWRYPHPRSRIILVQQGIEHAAQMARAAAVLDARGEPIGNLLDAIECVLQARVVPYRKMGTFFSALNGWEEPAGALKGMRASDLYQKPEERDRERDYTEGPISVGSAAPEGIVYFWETLSFYLAHRPAERLLQANPNLEILVGRMKPRKAVPRE